LIHFSVKKLFEGATYFLHNSYGLLVTEITRKQFYVKYLHRLRARKNLECMISNLNILISHRRGTNNRTFVISILENSIMEIR